MTEYRPPIDAELQSLLNKGTEFDRYGEIQPLDQAISALQQDLDDGADVKALHVGSEAELQEMKRRHQQSVRDKRRRAR